jgi:glycosyltransferase involved in cell wall biosynthesis
MYHGIDADALLRDPSDRIAASEGTLRLLYFGRLVSFKGVHTAVEAMGVLSDRGLADRVELTVVGGGHPDYEAHLRSLAAQLGVGHQIQFTGRLPWDELLMQLKRSDVMLFTTIGPEAMARTVMEAMAAGLLVIGTTQGGQKEMLFDGENAMVFQAGDALSLADCISRALDDPSLRYRLARAGQQTVLEQFTLSRMADDMEAWLGAISE